MALGIRLGIPRAGSGTNISSGIVAILPPVLTVRITSEGDTRITPEADQRVSIGA
jgi:hypothetical protein